MIIIADSGSTKTAWRILHENGEIEQEITLGLNPYYLSNESILKELESSFLTRYKNSASFLYFYGSGCAAQSKKEQMKNLFSKVLPKSNIEILDDITGAARATCNKNEGICGILGTGSNSCFYDGENVSMNIPGSGYVLGDEGSGSFMGKMLLGDFIRKQIPENLSKKLENRFTLNRESILENVYQQPQANRYMAQFSKFIFQNMKDPYCIDLVVKTFDLFFEKYITHYPAYKDVDVHFVGSIAFYFSNVLRKRGKKYGVRIKNILENPIAGLTLYHQN